MYKNGLTVVLKRVGQHQTDCMAKLDLYIDHRGCETLPSNATVETHATAIYLQSTKYGILLGTCTLKIDIADKQESA